MSRSTNLRSVTLRSAKLYRYQLPIDGTLVLRGQTVSKRDGWILELCCGEAIGSGQKIGRGEIAPLPGFSHETAEQAELQLRHVIATWVAQGRVDLTDCYPSVAFGVSMALLELADGLPHAANFTSALLLAADPAQIECLGIRLHSTPLVKLKIAVQQASVEGAVTNQLLQQYPALQLRLDANRRWDLATALQFADNISPSLRQQICFIEEPCQQPQDSLRFARETGIAIAWDETVRDAGFTVKAQAGLAAIVIKPSLTGSVEHCMALIQQAHAQGLTAVISSSLESSFGLQQLARLAQWLTPQTVPGLDTVNLFSQQLTVPWPDCDLPLLPLASLPFTSFLQPASDDISAFTCWPWQHWAALRPEQMALSFGQLSFTWQALRELVDIHASQLRDQGVKQDHVVAAVAANGLDVLCLYLACLRLGACCVVLNPKQSDSELQDKLGTLAAQYVWFADPKTQLAEAVTLGTESMLEFGASTMPIIEAMETVAAIDGLKNSSDNGFGNSSDNSSDENKASHIQWQPKRLMSLVFTSGSSAVAKAVAHSGENHLASAAGLLTKFSFKQEDSWLLSLPLFHVSGLAIVWRWLAVGARLVLPENKPLLSQLTKVTHASLVPTQLQRYLAELASMSAQNKVKNKKKSQVKSQLKRVLLGGAVIPVALTDRAKQANIECWLGYGMTETASTVTAKLADSSAGVGQVLPHRQLRLQDKQVMVQGAILGLGYYQKGELRLMTDNSGWLATGDLGAFIDNELFIIGRQDNMFISGGENIHPEQIERILLSHPAVTQALVFPCADPEFGQRPVAVIESTVNLEHAELCDYLQGKLTTFMWPVHYYYLPSAPNLPPELQTTGIKLVRSSVQHWLANIMYTHGHLR
ncbi:MAG: O-succinylbenzoic acid--CoA ligase [Moritella sp.]|jgi:O-succinylbenzoic acid--CoA ligase